MLLALNIGNTNVTFGGYDSAGQRVFASRFYSDSALSSDELVYKLVNMLALYHIQPRDVDAAILASVVPVLTSRMREALEKMTNAPLMEVGPGLKSGVRIRMDNPAQLGGELLCAAVGALQTHKPPLLVMNMDTAATLVAVDAAQRHCERQRPDAGWPVCPLPRHPARTGCPGHCHRHPARQHPGCLRHPH